jgi:ribose transport system ATP-binding protein
MSSPAAVELRNVWKSFDGVQVLKGVNLSIAPGEIHGLVGENGSGKSTLVKILGGTYTPDGDSQLFLKGDAVPLPLRNARRNGLAIIHQDLALVESMSVADNVGISTGFEQRLASPVRRRRENRIVAELARKFGLALDPQVLVSSLSPAERSVVAILRALRQLGGGSRGHVIVLDEPTAALPRSESIKLLELLRTMAENGTAVLYISHRMHEVLGVCDRISVLRSGQLVATRDAAESTEAEIVELMLGYELGEFYPEKHVGRNDAVALDVTGLSHGNITDLTFRAHRGEILGVTGLAGMGQDDIPYLVAGGRARLSGQVQVNGVDVDGSPSAAKAAGLQLVPGNRQRDAFWLGGTAAENLTLPFLGKFWRGVSLNARRERLFADEEMRTHSVRPLAPHLQITKFSGGNQQKIVMARALRQDPEVLLLHEPTQGVDAGAKKEILNLVSRAAEAGAAVVVFSSDSEEVAQLCHRVLIMRYGSVSATLSPGEVSEDRILALSQRTPVSESGGVVAS